MKHSQINMLEHSQAKVEIFRKYIEKYFAILQLSEFVQSINVYDTFCGMGVYANNKLGSPIQILEAIQENRKLFAQNKWKTKKITVTVNDGNAENIKKVKEYIEVREKENSNFNYHNLDASEIMKLVIVNLLRLPGHLVKEDFNTLTQ